jgi:hypothetical protein
MNQMMSMSRDLVPVRSSRSSELLPPPVLTPGIQPPVNEGSFQRMLGDEAKRLGTPHGSGWENGSASPESSCGQTEARPVEGSSRRGKLVPCRSRRRRICGATGGDNTGGAKPVGFARKRNIHNDYCN